MPVAGRYRTNTESSKYPERRNGTYIYGNTVRKADVMPDRRPEYNEPRPAKRVSKQVRTNRKQALRMNPAYVAFLAVATFLCIFACVWYVKLQTEVAQRAENIAIMQQELVEKKEENTTRYNSVVDSVNLEDVRKRAINDLGMVHAESDQVILYENPTDNYMKQYEQIPEDGVLTE